MSQGSPTGKSEKHSLHSLHLLVFNGTRDELKRALYHILVDQTKCVFRVANPFRRLGTVKVVHHFADEFNHLFVVLKLFYASTYFFDGVARLKNECLHLPHLLLDSVEEQFVTLLLSQFD